MKKLASLLAGCTLGLSANAAMVTYDFSNPLSQTEISQTGSLGLFDSTLGTLLGASLVVDGVAVMNISGTNNAAQTQQATLTSTIDLQWTSSLASLNPFLTDTIQMSATSGSLQYAPGETKLFGPFNVADSLTDDLGAILASLQTAGGGTFSLTCDSISGLSVIGGGGNIGTEQSTQASCGASIAYTYSTDPIPAPEPASLALLGIGLAGLGFSRRKKA